MATARQPSLHDLEQAVRLIYQGDPVRSEERIEEYLETELDGVPRDRRLALLAELRSLFSSPFHHNTGTVLKKGRIVQKEPLAEDETDRAAWEEDRISREQDQAVPETSQNGRASNRTAALDEQTMATLLTRLLGSKAVKSDLSAPELLERITDAIGTIFDTLNQIIAVIRTSLFGESSNLETIRYVIGSTIESDGSSHSIEEHLDQVRNAFLISHQAFQEAAREKIRDIVTELDPDTIQRLASKGIKRGPFAKAEAFETFRDKHEVISRWLHSDKFKQDLQREFEKQCVMFCSKEGGRQ